MRISRGTTAEAVGSRRVITTLMIGALLSALLSIGGARPADAQGAVTNDCPATDISVALYGGSVSNGLVAGSSFLNEAAGFCVQVIPVADWSAMTIADFQLFDVLWIGNDDCGGSSASDFDVAAATVGTWEAAIDAGSVMVAGGDYDFHYDNGQANAIAVTQALVTEISDAAAPGLVLQAGCYAIRGAGWLQNLGGTFAGLSHAHTRSGDPSVTDVYTDHEFNVKYGFDSASYRFGASCHGGLAIDATAAVANYQLQPLFDYIGFPCFMFSDATVAPTFTRDIGDTVWCDTDGNGAFDAGEGLTGVTVTLTDDAGASQTTTTGADGAYLFVDQVIGTYTVAVDVATLPADCNMVAVDPDGGDDAMSVVTTTIGSTDNLSQDFGFVAPTVDPTPTPTPGPTTSPTPVPTPIPTAAPVADPAPTGPTGPLVPPPDIEQSPISEAFTMPDVGVPAVVPPVDAAPEEVLGITIEAAQGPPLAITGSSTDSAAQVGLLLLGLGASLASAARHIRRREDF